MKPIILLSNNALLSHLGVISRAVPDPVHLAAAWCFNGALHEFLSQYSFCSQILEVRGCHSVCRHGVPTWSVATKSNHNPSPKNLTGMKNDENIRFAPEIFNVLEPSKYSLPQAV